MKYVTGTTPLAAAVTAAAGGLPVSPLLPVHAGMLLRVTDGTCMFTASDGDTMFTATSPADNAVDGETIVPGKLFEQVVRSLPAGERVMIHTEPGVTRVKCGRISFTLRSPATEYPELPPAAAGIGAADGEGFAAAMRKAVPAAAKTHAQPELCAVCIEPGEQLTMVATDKYRVAAATCGWEGSPDTPPCLVPAWAAEKFARAAAPSGEKVTLGWDDRVVTLTSPALTVTSRVLGNSFPSWRHLLPGTEPRVEVDAGLLGAALRRAQITSDEDAPVTLTFTTGELQVTGEGDHLHGETIPAGYEGDAFTVLFGIPKLTDGLPGDGMVRFGFTSPLERVHIHSDGFRYVVLPRRRVHARLKEAEEESMTPGELEVFLTDKIPGERWDHTVPAICRFLEMYSPGVCCIGVGDLAESTYYITTLDDGKTFYATPEDSW